MNKFLKKAIVIAIISLFIPSIKVSAKNSDIIITKKGIEITKNEYDYLNNNLGEEFIDAANENFIKSALNNKVTKLQPIYEPTANEIMNPVPGLGLDIILNVYESSGQYLLAINGVWTTLPTVKSYDVVGFRWTNNFVIDSWNVKQVTNAGDVNYSLNGGNTKKASNGVGTSMNLVDAATKFINIQMEIYGHFTSSVSTTVSGSYQHAWSDVSLADSQNYTFSSSGLGKVFYYPSNIRSLYSNFSGRTFTFTPILMS